MKKFLYNILIIICCLFSFNFVQAAEIKFVQVSDTHYAMSNPYSEQVLKAAVADINNLDNVSFVVFTGDNIDKPNPEDLAKFVNIVNKLNAPYYLVIGNHDVFKTNGLSKKEYFEVVKNNNLFYNIFLMILLTFQQYKLELYAIDLLTHYFLQIYISTF